MAWNGPDYTGNKVGSCVVLYSLPRTADQYDKVWVLRCECGTLCQKVDAQVRKAGLKTRCGTCYASSVSRSNKKHGETNSYLYRLWENMRRRCYSPAQTNYHLYGGRGIKVHEPWRLSYLQFATDIRSTIGERPSAKYSIDRIENDGHYEPGNVRWATAKQQGANRRGWGPDTPKSVERRQTKARGTVANDGDRVGRIRALREKAILISLGL